MKPRHLIAAILSVLLLYAFSYGPVISWAELHPGIYFVVEHFYAPLLSIPGVSKPLNAYRSRSVEVIHPDTVVVYHVDMAPEDAASPKGTPPPVEGSPPPK